MLGVINLDKPVGPTSHDMVALVRRLSGLRRIGHAGTLDPLASGVLPILVGRATRLSEELTGGSKRYRATIRLGYRSLTDDAEGPIEPVDAPIPDDAAVRSAAAGFIGTFDQRPPTFSARKSEGQVAYRAARSGHPLDLPPRSVTVVRLEVDSISQSAEGTDVDIDLTCGPGTYVRSIARDLGERLGCGAYLVALRRTEAAGLQVTDGIEPAALERLSAVGRFAEAVRPLTTILSLPQLALDDAAADRFLHGQTVPVSDPPGERVAVMREGTVLGIGEVRDGTLRPLKVLVDPTES
jgi:tRNA pseudouridine55 synthase